MKGIFVKFLVFILRVLYAPLKLFKTKNQIVYLSRQRNQKDIDFELLENSIKKECPDVKQVFRLKMIDDGFISKVKYCFYIIGDMYYLATSKVAIVDTYSITVSCLHHKKDLKVLQIWHALGAIKKFGFQAFGTEEGRDEKISLAMHMHENYDYVIAPSKETAKFYIDAFNVSKDKIVICPMPRVDFITDGNAPFENFYSQNPDMVNKTIVLYLPTFRKKDSFVAQGLMAEFADKENYRLIVSCHPLSQMKKKAEFSFNGNFNTYELMKVADIIITDYSACAFEAALLNKPLYFYVPDFDDYMNKRGINVDIRKELPSAVFYDAENLVSSIMSNSYDMTKLIEFRDKFIENTDTLCSDSLAKLIHNMIGD